METLFKFFFGKDEQNGVRQMQNVSLRGRRQNEEGRKRKSGGWKHVNYLAEKCTSIEYRLYIKIGKDTSQITC